MSKLTPGMTVIHGFTTCVVREVKDGKVKRVAYGGIEMGGYDLLCFRPTEENVSLARTVDQIWNQMHETPGTNGLNWPMINAYLEQNCGHAMAGMISHEEAAGKAKKILEEVQRASSVKSCFGFDLFR